MMSKEIAAGVKTILIFMLVRELDIIEVNLVKSLTKPKVPLLDRPINCFKAPRKLPGLSAVHKILLLLPSEAAWPEGEVCQGLPSSDGGGPGPGL